MPIVEAYGDARAAAAREPYETVLRKWETDGDVTRMWLAKEFRDNTRLLGPAATWDHRPLGGGLCVCGQPVHTREQP